MESDSEDEDGNGRGEEFLRKLYAFHERNGAPIKRLPTLGGRELNLYHLYTKVRELNGFDEVTRNRQWGEVARSFNLPRSVTSASYATRQHYIRFLAKFEAFENDPNFANYFNSEVSSAPVGVANKPQTHPLTHSLTASQVSTSQGSQSSWSQPIPSTLPTFQRPSLSAGDGATGGGGRECDKIVRSLVSGFPNEVDFALNILTVMSFEKPASLPLTKVPYLLDVMLSHIGVFPEEDYGLEVLFNDCWCKSSEMDFLKFWERSAPDWVCDVIFPQLSDKNDSMLPGECTLTVYRVVQIANILRNLSFDPTHAHFLSQHSAMLRFLCLSCNCSVPSVRGLALDSLVNLAPYILLPVDEDSFSIVSLLFTSVQHWILSADKMAVLRGLEILGELAWCFRNEVMIAGTPHNVYRRIFELLLLPDCFILLTALDTLYNLTVLGDQISDKIVSIDRSISTLLNLLTLRVESFGEKALACVKLIDTAPPSTKSSVDGASSKLTTSSGRNVQLKVLHRGTAPHLAASNSSKKIGGGSSVKVNSVTQGKSSGVKTQVLKIGNTLVPTLNFGKKPQESGGTTLSPLIQSSSNTALVKAMLATSTGPLTLEQLQNLLVKSVPTLPLGSSTAQQSPQSSPLSVATTAQSSVSQARVAVTGSKLVPSTVNDGISRANGQNVASSMKIKPAVSEGVSGESYATSWLKSNFEESRGSYLTQMEVYSQYIKSCADANQPRMLNLTDFTKAIKTVFPNSLSTRITFANQIVYMIAGLAKKQKQASSISAQRDTAISPSIQSLVASPSNSRTPSPSLPSMVASNHSTTSNAKPLPLNPKASSSSPSPSLQNDQPSSSKLSASPSPSLHGSTLSNHVLASSSSSSLSQLKSVDRCSPSPSPLLHNPVRSSASPTPPPVCSSSTVPFPSNRLLHLGKSRESSLSPSPLSRVSLSPTPSLQDSSCTVPVQPVQDRPATASRDSLTPTPTNHLTQSLANSAHHKRSLSPVSLSSQHSTATADHLKLAALLKTRGSESPSPHPPPATHGSSLASISSSSLQSSLSSSISKPQDYLSRSSSTDELTLPDSKRIKLDNASNGHSVAGNERRPASRTPSPLVVITDKLESNRQNIVKLPARTCETSLTSSSAGLTALATTSIQSIGHHPTGTLSTGQTCLASSSLTEQTGLTTSSKSAFTPANISGNVLSNGTRIASTQRSEDSLHMPCWIDPSHEVGVVQSMEVSGPLCQWGNCTRRCSSPHSLFSHLVYDHLSNLPSYPSECHWQGCQLGSTKRMRPSLITHLQTHHCCLEPKPAPLNVAKTLQLLRSTSPFESEDESALTKAVRLTAALVLRNLARVSPRARSSLRCHESRLSQVALSDSEASTAAAQCLHIISSSTTLS